MSIGCGVAATWTGMALVVVLGAVLVALRFRGRRGAPTTDAQAASGMAGTPSCPRCGLNLMALETARSAGALLCPACQVRFTPESPSAAYETFPDGYREETDYDPGSDPSSEGTFFGI